jgi:hypothetical protein
MPPTNRVDPTLQSYVPSWICSKERLPFGTVSGLVNSRLNADILIGRYTAHGETRPQVRLGRDDFIGNHKGSLYCKGIVLGTIARRSARMAGGVITKEAVSLLSLGPSGQRWGKVPAGPRDTVIRSLCADHTAQGKPAPLHYRQALIQLVKLSPDAASTFKYASPSAKSATAVDPDELLEMGLSDEVENRVQAMRAAACNRRTFTAENVASGGNTMVGPMPRHANVGDKRCILNGCSVPVVLRKHVFGCRHRWELIGEAYVHGYMDGEAIFSMPLTKRKATEIEFEIR